MTLSLVDNGIGAVAHLTNAIVNGTPYITSRSGIYMFNGTWHPVMQDSSRTFSTHLSASSSDAEVNTTRSNASYYQTGWMVNNPVDKTLQLFLGKGMVFYITGFFKWWFSPGAVALPDQSGTYSWVLNYEPVQPQAGGSFGQALVSMDELERGNATFRRYTAASFLVTDDGGAANMWFGDGVGGLHREEPAAAFNGTSLILTPAYFFEEAGGYEREGKTLVKFWTFADNTSGSVYVIGGDEWAGMTATCYSSFATDSTKARVPYPDSIGERLWPNPTFGAEVQYSDNIVLASDMVVAVDGTTTFYAPKSVHEHPLPDMVSGRTFSFLYLFSGAVTWRGVGGYYVPGPATRPRLGVVQAPA